MKNIYYGGKRIAISNPERYQKRIDLVNELHRIAKEITFRVQDKLIRVIFSSGESEQLHPFWMYGRDKWMNIIELKNKGALLISREPMHPIDKDYIDLLYSITWLAGEKPVDGLQDKIKQVFEDSGFEENFDIFKGFSSNILGKNSKIIVTEISRHIV